MTSPVRTIVGFMLVWPAVGGPVAPAQPDATHRATARRIIARALPSPLTQQQPSASVSPHPPAPHQPALPHQGLDRRRSARFARYVSERQRPAGGDQRADRARTPR